jgi:hypothetical protein
MLEHFIILRTYVNHKSNLLFFKMHCIIHEADAVGSPAALLSWLCRCLPAQLIPAGIEEIRGPFPILMIPQEESRKPSGVR